MSLIQKLLYPIGPYGQAALSAATLLVGCGICALNEKNDESILQKAPSCEQTITSLKQEFQKLSQTQKRKAQLTYYQQLYDRFGRTSIQTGYSIKAIERTNEILTALHPSLKMKKFYKQGKHSAGEELNAYDFAAREAQKKAPLFEINIKTNKPISVNLYHIIVAEAINEAKTIDNVKAKIQQLNTQNSIGTARYTFNRTKNTR